MRLTAVMVSVDSYAHEAHADTQVSGEDNVPFPSHSVTSCVRALCGQAGSFMMAEIPGETGWDERLSEYHSGMWPPKACLACSPASGGGARLTGADL